MDIGRAVIQLPANETNLCRKGADIQQRAYIQQVDEPLAIIIEVIRAQGLVEINQLVLHGADDLIDIEMIFLQDGILKLCSYSENEQSYKHHQNTYLRAFNTSLSLNVYNFQFCSKYFDEDGNLNTVTKLLPKTLHFPFDFIKSAFSIDSSSKYCCREVEKAKRLQETQKSSRLSLKI